LEYLQRERPPGERSRGFFVFYDRTPSPMIVVMESQATESDVDFVVRQIREAGLEPHVSRGVERTIIGIIGDERRIQREHFALLPRVEDVIPILKPYKLASREFRRDGSIVDVRGVAIGGKAVVVIAGPCSVESEEQILQTALQVKGLGAQLLRGGAYKPRTSPYSFQGLGVDGLKLLAKVRESTGLGIVTEVMESSDVDIVAEYADMLQVGARNMQNTRLLRSVARLNKPVLLKRGFAATLNELLMSAEYILSGGNPRVVLCERGIRTFVDYSRNTLDLNVVPAVHELSHLPIIVDPSHGTGRHEFVLPMSLAAVAAGADGLMIEVHPNPVDALSDGEQSITPQSFQALMSQVRAVARAVGRT
jgi:3-deoxy-7-phosphoheptulonate synthase